MTKPVAKPDTVETLAQILYASYCATASIGPKDPRIPAWHQLTGRRRRGWVAVAGAACAAPLNPNRRLGRCRAGATDRAAAPRGAGQHGGLSVTHAAAVLVCALGFAGYELGDRAASCNTASRMPPTTADLAVPASLPAGRRARARRPDAPSCRATSSAPSAGAAPPAPPGAVVRVRRAASPSGTGAVPGRRARFRSDAGAG